MVFVLICLVLFFSIAFFNAIQGAFSAFIMFVLTVISAAAAVNYYQPLSEAWLLPYIGDYADPCALGLIFFLTLGILRALADNLIRGNVVLSAWIDRIIAAIISIPTGLIITGMAAIIVQMLPLDEQVMLYNRFEYSQEEPERLIRKGLFPYADDFTAGLISKLSNISLGKNNRFDLVHPDWPAELSAQRIAIQRESRHTVPVGSIKATSAWKFDSPLLIKKYSEPQRRAYYRRPPTIEIIGKYRPKEGHYFLGITLELSPKAADPDGYHRFAWGQVRLVGFRGENRTRTYNYYLIGLQDKRIPAEFNYARIKVPLPLPEDDDEAPVRYRNFGYISEQKAGSAETVNIIFEVPEDFTPWFIEYKRHARAVVPKISADGTGLSGPIKEGKDTLNMVGQIARKGWRATFRVNPERTGFFNTLPSYLSQEPSAKEFQIPAGKKALFVECILEKPEGNILRMIFSAIEGAVPKMAVDSSGNKYLPVAQYIIIEDGKDRKVEFAYDPIYAEAGKIPPFRRLDPKEGINKTVHIGFIFFVPPSTLIERFEIGGIPIESQVLNLLSPE